MPVRPHASSPRPTHQLWPVSDQLPAFREQRRLDRRWCGGLGSGLWLIALGASERLGVTGVEMLFRARRGGCGHG